MSDITLTITEDEPVSLKIVEAALKPEQEKSVEPTYEPQTVLPDAGCVLSAVHVGAIPPVMLQNKQFTPTKQIQTVTADEGYDGLESVEVEPIPDEYIIPAGKKQINITQNGTTQHDVTEYADAKIIANVNTDPEKGLVFGDYDADGYPTTARFVGAWTDIGHQCYYLFQKSFDSTTFGSKIKKLIIPNGVTTIQSSAFFYCEALEELILPNTLTTIVGTNCFYRVVAPITIPASFTTWISNQQFSNYLGKTIVFLGNCPDMPNACFAGANNVELYDFSHCTSIPSLYSVVSLGHKNGCVIRISASLSDTTLGTGNGWESATNWAALTNIVWEVV